MNKRITELFKRRYTREAVGFSAIFPAKVGAKPSFEWMLERTLMRPRDIIAFVNECINAADGRSAVSVAAMRKAEVEFARKRRDALLQEWMSSFPSVGRLLDCLTSKKKTNLSLGEFSEADMDELALSVCSDGKSVFDPVFDKCQAYLDGKSRDKFDLIREAVTILYRTVAIGVKLNDNEHLAYARLNQPLISPNLITLQTRVRLVPMLHAAFHMQEH